MIFFERFDKRTSSWREFREELETVDQPIDRAIRFWNQAPISARTCDPYDRDTWPKAWQLLEENKYCEFGKILAIYYTISLTDRYADAKFEIRIAQDRSKQRLYYLLIVDDMVIGYEYDRAIHISQLPATLEMQGVFVMVNDQDY
jgi:hypothetical protein